MYLNALLPSIALLLCLASWSFSAIAAGPLDLSDPTPRSIDLSVDQDVSDLALVGGAYSLPFDASFTSDGAVATVSIPGATVESLITDVFNGLAAAVPGSFSDYVISIDVNTNAVLSAAATGQISSPIGNLAVTHRATSSEVSGFTITDLLGAQVPIYCTAGSDCTLVQGLPFDPETGTANAVGEVNATLVSVFTPFGDVRLTEQGTADCAVAVEQANYGPGDTLSFSFSIDNNLAVAQAIELKLWLEIPGYGEQTIFNLGGQGELVMIPNDSIVLPSSPLLVVDASTPPGQWSFGCRVLNVVTGEELGIGLAPFGVNN